MKTEIECRINPQQSNETLLCEITTPYVHLVIGVTSTLAATRSYTRLFRFSTTAFELQFWRSGGSGVGGGCLLYTSPSPRDATLSRMPSSA